MRISNWVLVASLVILPPLLYTQTEIWQPTNGPRGGFITKVAVHPFDDQRIIAFETSGIYRTSNGGQTWSRSSDLQGILFLVYSCSNPPVLFGATASSLFLSVDDGLTWTVALPYHLRSLTTDRAGQGRVLAGADSGKVFFSTNNGSSWSFHHTGSQWPIGTVALSPDDSLLMFAGAVGDFDFPGDGLFRSSDGGNTWTNRTFNNSNVTTIDFDPSSSSLIYLGTGGSGMYWGQGMYKSTNSGITWDSINVGLPDFSTVRSVLINPNQPQHVYAALIAYFEGEQMYLSTNSGTTWSRMNLGVSAGVRDLDYALSNPQEYFLGTTAGLLRGTFGGNEFHLIGVTPVSISSIAIHPTQVQTLHAIGGGIFKTTNAGENWDLTNEGLRGGQVIAINPLNPNILYAADYSPYGVVAKSTNGGLLWIPTSLQEVAINDLAINPLNPDIVFAGGLVDSQIGGMFRTINGGASWDTLRNGIGTAVVRSIAIDPSSPSTVYVGTMQHGIFKSTDAGDSWSSINTGLPPPAQFFGYVSDIAVDPGHSYVVYASLYLAGVFKSTSGGAQWDSVNAGLATRDIRAIIIDPQDSQRLYAGTWGSGVFKSVNGGASWTPMNNGWDSVKVISLALTSERLYAGLSGGGVWMYDFTPLSVSGGELIPSAPMLYQNYPNPFNPKTSFRFKVSGSKLVTLMVYDVLGREVATLVNEVKAPGSYEVTFDGSNLASGLYLLRLVSGDAFMGRKILLLK